MKRIVKSIIILLSICLMTGCSLLSGESELKEVSLETKEPIAVITQAPATQSVQVTTVPEESILATDLIKTMGAGWNLGNTLDAWINDGGHTDHTETYWGNPVTTKEMIDQIKEEGFGIVRVPVTYRDHMDENGVIDVAWLQRVEEVVNYVIEDGMYCVINVHHDTGKDGWLKAELSDLQDNKVKLSKMWMQIAEHFSAYNDKLIFEGYNEILNSENKWTWAGNDAYEAANQLNQTFVDTVRSAGGFNAKRNLIVNTYAASAESEVISHFVLPKDSVENHLIVGVHSYVETQGLPNLFTNLEAVFTSKGIPVVIGEFGMKRQSSQQKRIEYANYYAQKSPEKGIGYFWWDDGHYKLGNNDLCDYAIFNRNTLSWGSHEVADALVSPFITQ